jgi:3-hydroxyacyl-CoA dehydrogenase
MTGVFKASARAARRGGPMFYADTVGLENVVHRMDAFAGGYQGGEWKPAPLLSRLAREGGSFSGS